MSRGMSIAEYGANSSILKNSTTNVLGEEDYDSEDEPLITYPSPKSNKGSMR